MGGFVMVDISIVSSFKIFPKVVRMAILAELILPSGNLMLMMPIDGLGYTLSRFWEYEMSSIFIPMLVKSNRPMNTSQLKTRIGWNST